MEKQIFITTSIAYINAEPHIGFLLELLAADVLKRSIEQTNRSAYLLTGTDEHGTKIEQAAKLAGKEPKLFADELSEKFKQLCDDFNISNDSFIRTSDQAHITFVQDAWRILEQKGTLIKKRYKGYYCIGCEAFKTEREIIDGKCMVHERLVEEIEEDNYFFQITPFKKRIIEWLDAGAIYPQSKIAEVKNQLAELDDISVSRPLTKLQWGIAVPTDKEQVMYVWLDALLNYLSGIKAANKEINELWPADFQIIGKDILKFHAIIWPAILLALDYELPKKLLVHGFVNLDGKKLSKSTGNIVYPNELKERYGVEASRYLILRQLNFYEDSNFVWGDFDAVYNGELANGLGNLVNRIVGISKKNNLRPKLMEEAIDANPSDFADRLSEANKQITLADQLITSEKLWEDTLNKTHLLEEATKYLLTAVYLLQPVLPKTSEEIHRQLSTLESKSLFPRIEKTTV